MTLAGASLIATCALLENLKATRLCTFYTNEMITCTMSGARSYTADLPQGGLEVPFIGRRTNIMKSCTYELIMTRIKSPTPQIKTLAKLYGIYVTVHGKRPYGTI